MRRTIQTPSTATLRPMRDESVNFDTTESLIIEGDNLEQDDEWPWLLAVRLNKIA